MNEQMQQLVTQGLDTALQYVQSASNFAAEQAPIVIQEILHYGLAKAIVYCTIWTLVTALGVYITTRAYHAAKGSSDEEIFLLPAAATIAPFVGMIIELLVICQILFAPRLYLLEQLKVLISTGCK